MATYADPADVEVSLGRPLTADENTLALALLARIEARINRRTGELAPQVVDDPALQTVLVEVEADAVARVLRNPDGFRQEQDGDYMYIRSGSEATGTLGLTREEWARLGVPVGAFTIAPTLGANAERVWTTPDAWSPA